MKVIIGLHRQMDRGSEEEDDKDSEHGCAMGVWTMT